jgi:hypothetical protein
VGGHLGRHSTLSRNSHCVLLSPGIYSRRKRVQHQSAHTRSTQGQPLGRGAGRHPDSEPPHTLGERTARKRP